jgi:hypothetical protein
MRPKRAEIAQAINGIDATPAGIGNRRFQGEVVAVDSAEEGDSESMLAGLWLSQR